MSKIKQIVHIDDISDTEITYKVRYIIDGDRSMDLMSEICGHKKYTPTPGDKLWIYPNSNIPRFKMGQFCKSNKVAMVKDKDKSTCKFMSSDYLTNQISYETYITKVDTTRVIAWLTNSIGKTKLVFLEGDTPRTIQEFIQCIKDTGNDIVSFNTYEYDNQLLEYADNSKDHLLSRKKNCLLTEKELSDDCDDDDSDNDDVEDDGIVYWKIKEDCESEISSIIADPSIYNSHDLLSRLNTGVVMTEDMYDQTQKMLKSNDTENQNVGIEAMASCDFQKSAVYLLMLIKSNSTTLYNNSNSKHVNFKSLLKFFNCTTQSLRTTDDIITSLKHQKLFSIANLNMLMPLVMEEIREGGDTHYVRVKDVELTKDAEDAIAENILDSQVEIVEDPKEPVLGDL